MQAESAAPRRWRARRQCRRGSFKVSRRLSAVSWRLEGRSAAGHGGSGRSPPGPPNGVFFLQSKKSGHTVKQVLDVKEKFFRQAATLAARRRRGAVDGRIRERRATGLNALGRHLLVELFDCDPDVINSLESVKEALIEAAKRAQATIVDVVFHEFNPFGISGVVVIAESHLSIHTWPEYRYAAVDIFSCGDVLQPEVAASYLVEQFAAERTSIVEMQRGMFLNSRVPIVHKATVAVS